MVDKPKLERILSNCQEYLQSLHRLRSLPRQEFLTDPDRVASAKYHFVVSIEACIDAANHIISSERYRLPADSADSFRVLGENGIVPEDLLPALVGMARFRNRLVHLYWDIDDERVRDYAENNLQDIERYLEAVSAFAAAG